MEDITVKDIKTLFKAANEVAKLHNVEVSPTIEVIEDEDGLWNQYGLRFQNNFSKEVEDLILHREPITELDDMEESYETI